MDEKTQKLAIGISAGDRVHTDMMFCLIALLGQLPIQMEVLIQQGCYVHVNREHIALGAQEIEASHLLFIDTDMLFNAVVVKTMVERDKDIIAAAYNLRRFPLTSSVKLADGNGKYLDMTLPQEPGPFRCAAAGTGFMLIKMSVFDRLKRPWFQTPPTIDNKTIWGEDVFFCKSALQAGIEVWAEKFENVKHIGNYYY